MAGSTCSQEEGPMSGTGEERSNGKAGSDAEIPPGLGEGFETLARIMARLRSPSGCPWDLKQTPETLSRHMLEEAYEAVEAIDAADWGHLEEELGDLLLQIVFQSRIAEEDDRFDLAGVVRGITLKLERRHPHIFGDVEASDAEQVSINWDRIKREEEGEESSAALRMPPGLPAIMAAQKIQGQAARVGFDWASGEGVFEKLEEESEELREVREGSTEQKEKELGDLLFTVVNLARHLNVDPEKALRRSCREFVHRYEKMEEEARRKGLDFASLPLEEKDELWNQVKSVEDHGEEK